ncbi:MAG: 8-oxoguanine deaminase [Lachnospiraceae bacterium]|jgi:cytosine/adenosine deaminase-related metal-dependent hydrolase|nr:8-oxoguanine deaminase [Lachnospiraceae bacterium]
MSKVLIKHAQAIVTVDDSDRVLYDADILILDGVITQIGHGIDAALASSGSESTHYAQPGSAAETYAAPPPPCRHGLDARECGDATDATDVIDANGCIIYPGLVNTHHHLYQTFTRNLPQVQRMELFPWLRALYEIWRGLDDEAVYLSSLSGMGELVRYGCTTVMDHHYVFPRDRDCAFLERQFEAADALGVRLCAARGSMSRGKSDGGLPPDDLVQDVDTILRDSQRLAETFHDPSPRSYHQVVLAPCSPFSVSDALLRETAVLARDLGVRLHTHLCETKDEEAFCLETVGMRPLAYMESMGWVGSDVWYAHGIHFDDSELELLAATQTGVAHCPASNMKLSSGVCRIPEMLSLGIPLGLAVDGSASNDCSNLMSEIRTAYLLGRLSRSQEAPTGYDILRMATRGSARLLGRHDIGWLAPGMAADMFAIDTRTLDFAGATGDPANLLGTMGCARPAAWTMVGGRIVSRDGHLTGIDEETTCARARESATKLCHHVTP